MKQAVISLLHLTALRPTKFWITDITDPPPTEAIVVGIREILANSAQARPFSRNGRQLVAREPTIATIVDQLAHMYQGV